MPEVTDQELADYLKWLVTNTRWNSSGSFLDEVRRVLRRELAYYVKMSSGGYVRVMNASTEEDAQRAASPYGLILETIFETDLPTRGIKDSFLIHQIDLAKNGT